MMSISPPRRRSVYRRVGAEPFLVLLVLGLFSVFCQHPVSADIIISEIADQGTSSACDGGNDWLELYNTATGASENDTAAFNLSGLILHDDQGVNDTSAYTFPQGQQLGPGEYLVLCMEGTNDPLTSPQFKIGGSDTITLYNPATQEIVASVGPLPDGAERSYDVTYAWNNDLDMAAIMSSSLSSLSYYMYTSTPTPGSANILTPILNETVEQIKERLSLQNSLGTQFFGMDDNGLPVADRLDEVLDLHLTMEQADYDYLIQNASFQLYSPFNSVRVTRNNSGVEEELLVLNSPGRLRSKGQSTLSIAACMGTPAMPFLVEFNNVNKSQTLFGVEKMYLRNHFMDGSYAREWSAHRMLARFGLPHLRARKMRLFLNGNRIGLYTVLEAAEQEYVFRRSFPNYTLDSYALYKVKTQSIACGTYQPERLERAQLRMDETATPPYVFERGDHRERAIVRGPEDLNACFDDFINSLFEEFDDVELAYLRHNRDCGEMVVNEGLVDLDLGMKDWDSSMVQFFNSHLGEFKCEDVSDNIVNWRSFTNQSALPQLTFFCSFQEACQNSNLAQEVDIENFLKSFAFYAVTIQSDSPLGNGNNYYLAATGDGTGWKIVGYDHNFGGGGALCEAECDAHLPSWSILRPTCGPLHQTQLAGPLLSNATLRAQYVEYVRAFTNDVLGNVSFIEEMTNHLKAIEEYVVEDYWGAGGQMFALELSPNASDWQNVGFPMIPFYKSRVEEVRRELSSLDNGTTPREVETFEVCVDWHSTGPPESNCTQACRYQGCQGDGILNLNFCDEPNGICYQAEADALCEGIPEGERYDGMENDTACSNFTGFFAVKLRECPAPLVENDATAPSPTTTSGGDNETASPEMPTSEDDGDETIQENGGSTAAPINHDKFQILVAFVTFVSSWLFI
jgi:Lamin Tail Domain/CotH kinase protein